MKYKEPDRLEIRDRRSRRRVLILSKRGHLCAHTDDDYLFIACGDDGARVRKHPERGVVIRYDKFFAAINTLIEGEIKNWDKSCPFPMGNKKGHKREKKNCEK